MKSRYELELEQVSRQLLADGWKVREEREEDDKRLTASATQPDLVAERGTELRLVVVLSRREVGLSDRERLTTLLA